MSWDRLEVARRLSSEPSGSIVGVALVMEKLDVDEDEARERLAAADGSLEHVIGRA